MEDILSSCPAEIKTGSQVPVSMLIDSCLESLSQPVTQCNASRISSGFTAIDFLTKGLETTSLVTVVGRPGMGKTSFALDLILNVCLNTDKTAVFFSYEIGKEQIMLRLLSKMSHVPLSDIFDRHFSEDDWKRICYAASELREARIIIDDSYSHTIEEIRDICKQIKNPGLICIDYLQLVNCKSSFESQRYIEIMKSLKSIAEHISAPVICLSQIPRNVEARDDKRPVLSDLSYPIENKSDIVIGLYRDSYYDPCSPYDSAEAIVLKNKFGKTGTARIGWAWELASFYNIC